MFLVGRYSFRFPKSMRCIEVHSRWMASDTQTTPPQATPITTPIKVPPPVTVDPKPKANKSNKTPKDSDSFMMNLFRGVINTKNLFPYPDVLTEDQMETLTLLIDPVTKHFTEVNDAAGNDANEKVSDVELAALWELGAFSLQVPQELGGLGLTNTQYARLVEIVGAHDLAVGITLGSHQSIGFKGILIIGTPEQKAKYLPRVSTGKDYAAFCLTEPSCGSDASSVKTRALLAPDGTHFVLNGSKIWISNGGFAEIMTVFAQTPIKDKTGKSVDKVTAFIVERSFGGVTSGAPEKKMGIKASNTTEVYFEDVKVPIENVLGEVGGGFKVAMAILNNGRFGMGAALSGTMRNVASTAVEFAKQRVQFGNHISTYGAIQEKLARMSMLHYVTESMAYVVSGNMDAGVTEYHLEAAVSKIFASEAAWNVTDEAIQVMGGMGYMRDTGLERKLRDLRIFRIFEGTNDILRLFIALTGMQYAGPHLRELQKALKNPTDNVGMIFQQAQTRIIHAVGLSNGPSLAHLVHPTLAPYMVKASRSIELFGFSVEAMLIRYGKRIANEQFVLKRIADSAIDIYAMMSVLSRATSSLQKGLPSAQHEALITQVWCNEASERVKSNLKTVSDPNMIRDFRKMALIAQNMCGKGGIVQMNPLGI